MFMTDDILSSVEAGNQRNPRSGRSFRHITKNIFDEISRFYKEERECDSSEIGSVFLVFGPKPDLETDDYTVIINT